MHHLTCKLKFVRSASTGLKQNSEKERNEKKKELFISYVWTFTYVSVCACIFMHDVKQINKINKNKLFHSEITFGRSKERNRL